MLSKTNLVLTYFHNITGPRIILSHPEDVPENISTVIKGLFDIEGLENPFLEVVLFDDKVKLTSLYFEIPSEWARGNVEMVMLSVISSNNENTDYYYDILKEASSKIKSSINIYKSLYNRDRISEKDGEIGKKYKELKDICLEAIDVFDHKRREETLLGLISSRKLTLNGAYNLFGNILVDIISSILQQKKVILCGDIETSASVFRLMNRLFHDIIELKEYLVVQKECEEIDSKILIINTSLILKESGEISEEGHVTINKYLQEAEKTGDKQASIIFIRQHMSILLKVTNMLEKILKERKNTKRVLKDIHKHLKLKLRVDELRTVLLMLRTRGREDIANRVIVSKFDKF